MSADAADWISLFDVPDEREDDVVPAFIEGQLGLLGGDGFGQMTMVDEVETTLSVDAAAAATHEWIGLPAFREDWKPTRLVLAFENDDDRRAFMSHVGIETVHKGTRGTLSVWYPDKEREDLSSLRFVVEEFQQ